VYKETASTKGILSSSLIHAAVFSIYTIVFIYYFFPLKKMKCWSCAEYKSEIKDLMAEIRELKRDNNRLEVRNIELSSRWYLKKCNYCPRDIAGHYAECIQLTAIKNES
jgi:hypothetical protein